MLTRRMMKSNTSIDLIGRYLLLLLSLIIMGGCSRKPQGDSVSFADSVTPCKKEGYRKVLVVHSYNHDHVWVQSVSRGIRMVLDFRNVEVQLFYMDTMNHPDPEWMARKGDEALTVIGQWNPDVVITADDNAQEYVGKKLVREGQVPVVFCGVNMDPGRYGYPAKTVTGVLERPHFSETVSLLEQLLGKKEPLRLLVLLDCNANTGYIFDSMKAQINPRSVESLEWSAPGTFEEWKETIQKAQSQVDAIAVYLCYPVLRDSSSQLTMSSLEVLAWTNQNSRIPIAGFLPSAAKSDCLCGVLESGLEQGKMAGQMAGKILNGVEPAKLEMQTVLAGQPMMNLKTAQKLGIHVSDDVISRIDILNGANEIKNPL